MLGKSKRVSHSVLRIHANVFYVTKSTPFSLADLVQVSWLHSKEKCFTLAVPTMEGSKYCTSHKSTYKISQTFKVASSQSHALTSPCMASFLDPIGHFCLSIFFQIQMFLAVAAFQYPTFWLSSPPLGWIEILPSHFQTLQVTQGLDQLNIILSKGVHVQSLST